MALGNHAFSGYQTIIILIISLERENARNHDGFISGTSESDNDDYMSHSKKSLNFKQRKSKWVSIQCYVVIVI